MCVCCVVLCCSFALSNTTMSIYRCVNYYTSHSIVCITHSKSKQSLPHFVMYTTVVDCNSNKFAWIVSVWRLNKRARNQHTLHSCKIHQAFNNKLRSVFTIIMHIFNEMVWYIRYSNANRNVHRACCCLCNFNFNLKLPHSHSHALQCYFVCLLTNLFEYYFIFVSFSLFF